MYTLRKNIQGMEMFESTRFKNYNITLNDDNRKKTCVNVKTNRLKWIKIELTRIRRERTKNYLVKR